jgi:cholesterol transport system auxiliary component
VSPIEVTPYETLQWTEEPEAYVRRALARALFDERPIDEVVSGAAPTLEVEVIAFEEVTYRHAGRVALRYELQNDRTTIARGTISIERRATRPNIEGVVEAIGAALDAATEELADRVEAALRGPPASDEESVEAQR